LDQLHGAFEQALAVLGEPVPVAVGLVDGHIAVCGCKIIDTLNVHQHLLLPMPVGRFGIRAAAVDGIKNAGVNVFEIPVYSNRFFGHIRLMGDGGDGKINGFHVLPWQEHT
jgi:hypothetical protein